MNQEGPKHAKIGNEVVASSVGSVLAPTTVVGASDLSLRRQAKIDEHLGEVLDSSDTLGACMGPLLCDTLEMCQTLKMAVAQKIASAASPLVGVNGSTSLIQIYLQMLRQAERLANLDCRIRDSRSARPSVETD